MALQTEQQPHFGAVEEGFFELRGAQAEGDVHAAAVGGSGGWVVGFWVGGEGFVEEG